MNRSPPRRRSAIPPIRDVRVSKSEASDFAYSMIKVIVGNEIDRKTFFVHESVVRDRAKFFHMALNGKWKESDEKQVVLPDDEPKIFHIYLQLLYRNILPIKSSKEDGSPDEEFRNLIKLYVLAEMLQDAHTKNLTIDALLAKWRRWDYFPNLQTIAIAYDGTPESSPLRRLLVDIFVDHASADWLDEKYGTAPADFLYDLSCRLLERRRRPFGETTDDCDSRKYHTRERDLRNDETTRK